MSTQAPLISDESTIVSRIVIEHKPRDEPADVIVQLRSGALITFNSLELHGHLQAELSIIVGEQLPVELLDILRTRDQ